MGITTFTNPDNYGLSLTLGGGEVQMIDMAVAFGVLANQGVKVPLQPILKVTTWTGEVLFEYHPDSAIEALNSLTLDPDKQSPGANLHVENSSDTVLTRVLNRAPAYLTSHILLDNNSRINAFGSLSELVVDNQAVSVKTGTTNNLRDNWTLGYTPEFLTAVWVGNNDNTPMNPYLVSGVTGAAPIFNAIMSHVLRDQEPLWPEQPDDVISRPVCTISGLVSHPDRPCSVRNEFFWEDTQPGTFDQTQKEIWVKEDTGFEPEEGDTENLKLEMHTVLSDPLTKDYCLDCARPTDEQGQTVQDRIIIKYPLVVIQAQ
jgi:membrane carboxypeptidase/penicillin-binding protein PbpC